MTVMGDVWKVQCEQCRVLHLGSDEELARSRARLHVEVRGHAVAVHRLTVDVGDQA